MWEYARYLASVGNDVTFVAASYPGAVKQELLEGISVVRLGGTNSLWLRTFLYYRRQGRGKFNVVVAEGFGGSRIPRLVPLYVKEPIITEWHQIHRDLFAAQYGKLLHGPLNLLERFTARVHRNTLVRAGVIEWQEAFPRLGFRPQNIFLVPVSIREEWLKEPIVNPGSEPTIVWLGKFRRYKYPHHAVLAMHRVIERVPAARLTLAGRHDDRPYEKDIVNLVRRLGLDSHVEFRFNISEEEKRNLLARSCVLVLPSAVEGFGIVVLEANACGVPVVGSSGVPESVVREKYNGLRYPTGDINALADCICTVLLDRQTRARLSANAIEFAKRFGWSTVGQQFEQIVRALAANTKKGRVEVGIG